MANMSYCRFENTLSAFNDCLRALREEGLYDLDSTELKAAMELAELAREFDSAFAEATSVKDEEDESVG